MACLLSLAIITEVELLIDCIGPLWAGRQPVIISVIIAFIE